MAPVIENENTFRVAASTGLNLFLGAGFSVLANNERQSLPLGPELRNLLIKNFLLSKDSPLTLPRICTLLKKRNYKEFRDFIKEQYIVHSYDDLYNKIINIRINSIMTTNVDDLIWKIFDGSTENYINDVLLRGAHYAEKRAIDYVPLHGSVRNDNTELVFGDIDLARAFAADPDRWGLLTSRIQQTPTLFWGYSLSDSGTLEALHTDTVLGRPHADKWIVVREKDDEESAYFEALGFQIIVSETKELLAYFGTLGARQETRRVPGDDVEARFDVERIPSPANLPVRPIIEFYKGSPPYWQDVFSGKIYLSSQYRRVLDSVHSDRNTVVVGVPACGKTTILMQVASNSRADGVKLFVDYCTPERAKSISDRLEGRKCTLFIDNFADSVESIGVLLESKNIQICCADRYFNYQTALHRFERSKFNIVDVSEISTLDAADIFQMIPNEIRKSTLTTPSIAEGIQPSVHEFIEQNTKFPLLSGRYKEILHDLDANSRDVHDFFVACCYAHSCRIPMSFDMASPLLGYDTRYDVVYDKIKSLGKMITDYVSDFVDESDQDYFIPRSTIVADAVIRQVNTAGFRRVFESFHQKLSPFRIARYDVFKRYGFDAKYAAKAFGNWRDGEEFYRKMYNRDNSYYLKQQCAIYLGMRKRNKEAFAWIEEAANESSRRIPSIMNTYAVILFEANIDLAGNSSDVKSTLVDSMNILERCYASDKRKLFHALKFAEHSVRFFDAYGSGDGRKYLELARSWLSEEEGSQSSNRALRPIRVHLRSIDTRLGQ